MKATFNGRVVAQSDDTLVIEGNHYFPPDSINKEYFKDSDEISICPWKGAAKYYDVVVDGEVVSGGAWYYPEPKESAIAMAGDFTDYVAFWRGVEVSG